METEELVARIQIQVELAERFGRGVIWQGQVFGAHRTDARRARRRCRTDFTRRGNRGRRIERNAGYARRLAALRARVRE